MSAAKALKARHRLIRAGWLVAEAWDEGSNQYIVQVVRDVGGEQLVARFQLSGDAVLESPYQFWAHFYNEVFKQGERAIHEHANRPKPTDSDAERPAGKDSGLWTPGGGILDAGGNPV